MTSAVRSSPGVIQARPDSEALNTSSNPFSLAIAGTGAGGTGAGAGCAGGWAGAAAGFAGAAGVCANTGAALSAIAVRASDAAIAEPLITLNPFECRKPLILHQIGGR